VFTECSKLDLTVSEFSWRLRLKTTRNFRLTEIRTGRILSTDQRVVATPACSVTNPNSVKQSNVYFCSHVAGSSQLSRTSAPAGFFAILFQDSNYGFLCSVDRPSLYNLVNETSLVHDLFLVYFANFIYNLYTFRTSPGPSSRGTTVFMRHLVLVILYSLPSGMQDPSCIPDRMDPAYQKVSYTENKYQMSHKYSCSSWWWTWRGPKHVQVIYKIDEVH